MKAVILAGGGGTRLWPLSTQQKPKQFQKLVSKKTMLEETINRLDFLKASDIYLAINEEHYELVKQIAPQIPKKNIIIEPDLRDTAPCIGLAAAIINKRHPGEVMTVIYADHLIQNKHEFQEKLKTAEAIALTENTLNIIEVEATEANTNYGYVKLGELTKTINNNEIYKLDSFKEKPDKETAEKFLKEGNFLWNTGIYVWKADKLLKHYDSLQKDMYKKLDQIAEAYDNQTQDAVLHATYPSLEKISLDYAIMEKVDPSEVRIIKAKLGWSDIGTWEAIWKELPKNQDGNIIRGKVKTLETSGSLIYGDTGKKIKVIGLKDIIVVETAEGLLISKKSESSRVKEVL